MTFLAIGAAALLPEPPCSITTLIAYRGSSYGAKATNKAWSLSSYGKSSFFTSSSLCLAVNRFTCDVPVLPANIKFFLVSLEP